jgi:hypothetical protein
MRPRAPILKSASAASRGTDDAALARSRVKLHVAPPDLDRIQELAARRAERIADRHVRIDVRVVVHRVSTDDDDTIGDRELDPHVEGVTAPLTAMRAFHDDGAANDPRLEPRETIGPALNGGLECEAGCRVAKRDVDG